MNPFKSFGFISLNLTIFQADIEYLRQRGSRERASGPRLSLVNSKLEALTEQHVLAAKGSTFIPHCSSSRLPDKDGASAYRHLKSHSVWSQEHTDSTKSQRGIKKDQTNKTGFGAEVEIQPWWNISKDFYLWTGFHLRVTLSVCKWLWVDVAVRDPYW